MSGQAIFETPSLVNKPNVHLTEDEKDSRIKKPDIAFRNVVNRNEAVSLAKKTLGQNAELIDYYIRPYSEEKIGFLGSHLWLGLTARIKNKNSESEHCSFFVKTLPHHMPDLASYIQEKGCFRKEVGFVEQLLPILKSRFTGEPWTPRCYLAKSDTLVFEDLKLQGFANKSRFFDLPTMKAAVKCLGRFHACSLLAEEQLQGKSLDKLYPDLMEETEFRRTGRSYEWYCNAVNFAIWLAKELGLDPSRIKEATERVFEACEPSLTKRNVISHGDLWSSNLLFDAKSERCRLVDFQLLRYAPLAHDFTQLLYLCGTREFRRINESDMLECYYVTLIDSLTSSGYAGELPSREELMLSVEEQRLPAVVTAMIFHPTVLMDGKTAAKIMDEPDTYEAYYFKDRVPFVREIMNKDVDYATMLKENVEELVEMSMKLDSVPRPT